MNDDVRFERLLDDLLTGAAPSRAPARLRLDIASHTSDARQRPRWLALLKEPPMRLSSRVAVGAPTFRLASIAALTMILILALSAAVVTGASLLPTKLPAPFGLARNGSLVYHETGDIWVADATGANGQAIITGPENDSNPWYSHDGTQFAFGREDTNGTTRLMVARADGTGIVPLTADFIWADWSPDDKQLAVTHTVDGQVVMSIVNADGTGSPRPLDLGGIRLTSWVVWRPADGSELLFTGQRPGTTDLGLYAIQPDGTGLRTVGDVSTADNAWQLSFQNPQVSPDGSTVGFSNWEPNDAGKTDAWSHLRDVTTGSDRRIEDYSFPHFSPDGTTVVGEGDNTLVVSSLDGSQPNMEIRPAWVGSQSRAWDISPDGTKAYLTFGDPGAGTTWIFDLADGTGGQTAQPILNFPSWQRLAP
jgi:Tol biopolymer transport system component